MVVWRVWGDLFRGGESMWRVCGGCMEDVWRQSWGGEAVWKVCGGRKDRA